jgi:hypothetical protein
MIRQMMQRCRDLRRTARNAAIDLRFGGFAGGYRPNPVPGATGTGATDYAIMPQLFDGRIGPDDVLVDVGCGYGRVINWWLYRGFRNRIVGLEMMTEVAEHTRRRLRRHDNVTIVTGDAIANLPADGTLFYLFNPFDAEDVFQRFLDGVYERTGANPRLKIVYFAPVLVEAAQADPRWVIEMLPVALPRAGRFEERHRHVAVLTPRLGTRT